MPKSDKETRTYHLQVFEELLEDRSDYDPDAREVSRLIHPGRGVFTTYTKPPKRRYGTVEAINNIAGDASYVLTSALDEGLTSTLREWFDMGLVDPKLRNDMSLKRWIHNVKLILQDQLKLSNFYDVMSSWYPEYLDYGNGPIFVRDTNKPGVALNFQLYTYGEYVIGLDDEGNLNKFYDIIFMKPGQLVSRFGKENVPKEIVELSKEGKKGNVYYTVLHAVYEDDYLDKKVVSSYFLIGVGDHSKVLSKGSKGFKFPEKPLLKEGFYEFPAFVARMNVIGSDVWGVGLGAKALKHVKRLDQLEMGFLKATHKSIDPPTNIPSYMKNTADLLPGGRNYVRSPKDKVTATYDVRFNFEAAILAAERAEKRIEKIYFNDIFLTASRDPNASPLKARQVEEQSGEKTLRLGPIIKPVTSRFLRPMLSRCLNILARRGDLPAPPPGFEDINLDYQVEFTSVLAQVQKSIAAKPMQSFISYVGGVASYYPQAIDKVDIDASIDEMHDITGAPMTILRDEAGVKSIRDGRAKAQAAEKKKEEQAAMSQIQSQGSLDASQTAKNLSDAGANLVDVIGPGATN